MMYNLIRTDSSNKDFIQLVHSLDAYLAAIDGKEHSFYAQYNKIAKLSNVVVLYDDEKAVACGAIKEIEPRVMEVKRMFTKPQYRGKGAATKVLAELEAWATELGCRKTVLETGKRMPDAVALYKSRGYSLTANYGQYIGVDNSLCFEKVLVR